MDIKQTDLIPANVVKNVVDNGVPEWLTRIDEIAGNILKLMNEVKKFTPQNQPVKDTNTRNYMSFDEARQEKKKELEMKRKTMPIKENNTDEIKELIGGIIKTLSSLRGMGFGEKTIGDAIISLPFTINQTSEFLQKYYDKKYR